MRWQLWIVTALGSDSRLLRPCRKAAEGGGGADRAGAGVDPALPAGCDHLRGSTRDDPGENADVLKRTTGSELKGVPRFSVVLSPSDGGL